MYSKTLYLPFYLYLLLIFVLPKIYCVVFRIFLTINTSSAALIEFHDLSWNSIGSSRWRIRHRISDFLFSNFKINWCKHIQRASHLLRIAIGLRRWERTLASSGTVGAIKKKYMTVSHNFSINSIISFNISLNAWRLQ